MLADDFFRLAHHDVSGRPRVSPRVVALGLAAGLIAELLVARGVELSADGLVRPRGWAADALGAAVLAEITAEPAFHPVRIWLAYLADNAYARVGTRLADAGRVRVTRRWGRARYVPEDMNEAALPAALLSQKLRRSIELSFEEVSLAGLVAAAGLDRFLLDGAGPDVDARLRWYLARMWPPMRWLVEHTQTAVGEAILTHR